MGDSLRTTDTQKNRFPFIYTQRTVIHVRDWLKAAADFVLGVAIATAVCWLAVLLGQPLDDSIGYAGTLLNVGGLSLIAFDLMRARKTFNEPSLVKRLAARFAKWRNKPGDMRIAVGAGAITLGELTVKGVGSVRTPSLERRVTLLEEGLNQLRADHAQRLTAVDTEITTVRAALTIEETKRAEAVEQLERTIRELAIGGLHLAWLGFWWVLCGTLADGFSKPIAAMLR